MRPGLIAAHQGANDRAPAGIGSHVTEWSHIMTGMTDTVLAPAQMYQIFIKASPEAVWDAITRPEFSQLYFYGARISNTPESHKSVGPDGSVWGDSPTFEYDPPRRLVHGWRSLYDPELAQEPPSRVTWEIEPQPSGVTRVTIIHDQLEGAPKTAQSVSGAGWMLVLSGLKTVLETGQPLAS